MTRIAVFAVWFAGLVFLIYVTDPIKASLHPLAGLTLTAFYLLGVRTASLQAGEWLERRAG